MSLNTPKDTLLKLPVDIETVKGFLAEDEARALNRLALGVAKLGPVLEVGSYCGKSTIYIGVACKTSGNICYAVDHHRGSEEHQVGEEYHDPDLYDSSEELFDSFREFRRNMRKAGLEETVIPLVASSGLASRRWATPLGMVFIDGGHSREAAQIDYRSWVSHIVKGGILAIHDIFPNPDEGGQAPYEIYKLALASGLFEAKEMVSTLGVLVRV